LSDIAGLLGVAQRPVLVIGSDVWMDGAEEAALRLVESAGLPVIANGLGRGIIPAGHPLLVTRARAGAFGRADLVIVAGTPLDFRLGYGVFGSADVVNRARVVHVADSPDQLAGHVTLAASAAGDLSLALNGIREAWERLTNRPSYADWTTVLRAEADAAVAADGVMLGADCTPMHPGRIYGELLPRLTSDAIVIGDGGDFRVLRWPVRRAGPPGQLAGPRAVRLPGHRAWLRAGSPAGEGVRSDRPAAR